MTGAAALAALRQERHVSASAITTYLKCPRQYEHRYLLKTEPAHRAGALAFGSAIHASLALFYRHLLRVEEAPIEEMHEIFVDAWRRELDNPIPVLLDENDTPESLQSAGLNLLAVFHEKIERPHKVLDVEAPFAVELIDPTTGEELPKLVGVFDAVVEDADGGRHVLEHKSSKVRWSSDRVAYDYQITGYTLAAPLMGLGEADVRIQVLLKQKRPDLEVHTARRTAQDHRDLIQVIGGVTTAVHAGVFYPVRDWHCKSCPYAGVCVAG
jgi:CRISPR/Cas system-associated exonuclease Cas4 (RecB family)